MTESEEERAKVVAFLRAKAYELWCVGDDDGECRLTWAADDIEACEHHTLPPVP